MTNSIDKFLVTILLSGCFLSSFAQEVTMFPAIFGYRYYQDHVKIPNKEFDYLMLSSQAAVQDWERTKIYRTLYFVGVSVAGASLIWQIAQSYNQIDSNSRYSREPDNTHLCLTVGGSLAAVICGTLRVTYSKKAILKYNQPLDKKLSSILGLAGTK
jgi:hypothetical protein